jgi:hypothetical protein
VSSSIQEEGHHPTLECILFGEDKEKTHVIPMEEDARWNAEDELSDDESSYGSPRSTEESESFRFGLRLPALQGYLPTWNLMKPNNMG